ncbi:MAG: elongation factor P [Erythrobacter sp.]
MNTRYVFLLFVSAAGAAAALMADRAHSQDPSGAPADAAARPYNAKPVGGMLGVIRHGIWQCALPGDAGGEAFIDLPEEGFRIGTSSSYRSPAGTGIYLLRGTELVFTRGPKKDQHFRVLGVNTLQKLNADGSLSKLICTRVGGMR